jgi:membrane-bound lytic murein transglycosylase B/uncharacterized protein YoxC
MVKAVSARAFVALLSIAVALPAAFFPFGRAFAETTDCTTLPPEKAQLCAEYNKLQKEIDQLNQTLAGLTAQKNTYKGDISILTAQIKKAEAEIKQRNNTIAQLADEINDKTKHISELQQRINSGRESLAKLLREKNEDETRPLGMLLLTAGSFTSFFSDVDQIDAINKQLQVLFAQLRENQSQTEAERQALAAKKDAQTDARYAVEQQKQQVAATQAQKQQLLNITQNQEMQYQQVLADRQAKAAQIRAALFPLRDAASISFGDALDYAQAAQKKTGTPPALVLAILTQESNLGTNVGQCYLQNDQTGAGVGKNTGKSFPNVMHPTRDVPVFIGLSKQLGFNPHEQVVSCPIAGVGGWGGAMGPAQFIPSTWALYATRIAAARGVATPNPWDAQDAIMAMSLLLADNGAGSGYTAQFNAAARYYAGWSGPSTAAGRGYATQVMAKVSDIQKNVDFLANI